MKYLAPTAVPKHCLNEVCQNCQMHKNKPSRCCKPAVLNSGYYGLEAPEVYVGRKSAACSAFLNKHTGHALGRTDLLPLD